MLCVGTELGAETTAQYGLRFGGQVIHLDAAPERIGVNYSALPLVGDAKLTLLALVRRALPGPPAAAAGADAAARVSPPRSGSAPGCSPRAATLELGLLETIEGALPPDAITVWDMTILGYWAAPHLRLARRPAVPVPDGLGDARVRLAGGDRRARRPSRAPRARA